MEDIFNQTIICSNCKKKMEKVSVLRNGFKIRALECKKCGKHVYHPQDIEEFKKFQQLKQRSFNVKLRMVGNSYTVSIPREIIDLEQDMHKEMARQMERMNKIVRLMLEEPGKLSLFFNKDESEDENEENEDEEKPKKKLNLVEEDEE